MTRLLATTIAASALLLGAVPASAAVVIDPETHQPLISRYEAPFGVAVSPIKREVVPYDGKHTPGTIVISTAERRLYLVLEGGQALRYGVGVGRPGFQWDGINKVSAKREWPNWTPPAAMLKRRPDLPKWMPGGPANPLGARAMYLGSTEYRIHGSNEPGTIGQEVSSGCIRMTNEDVIDLYDRVKVGARVIVLR